MKRSRESISVGVADGDTSTKTSGGDSSETSSSSSASYEWKNAGGIAASTPCRGDTSKGSHKRPRTERYLQEVKKLEKQRETICFFQQRLQSLQMESATSSHEQQTLRHNLHKNFVSQEQKFHSFRQGMVETARERICLKNGILCMQRHVQLSATRASRSERCPMERLQQGDETTRALFELIAGFAGIPSESETQDCQDLIAVAACTKRS